MPVVNIRPKEQFQSQEDLCKKFGEMAHGNVLPMAITYTLAEYINTHSPSAEEITGARKFAHALLNMCEKDEPRPAFPVKTLKPVKQEQPQTQRHD